MNRELKFLNLPFEIKADNNNELIIEGYGAVKGNIDSYRDIIADGAFTKTLQEQDGRIAFCYQHDIWNPIGKIVEIREDVKGLWIKVRISDSEDDIKTKIREGILKEMSIGYSTVNSKSEIRDGVEVNILTEIKLYEISLVTLAANPLALIEALKADNKTNEDFVNDEFDRLIGLERNKQKKYELLKLKTLILNLPTDKQKVTEEENKPLMSKGEILNLLIN